MDLELYTDRLHLRPYVPSDADLDILMSTDPDVMEHFGGAVTEEKIVAEMVDFTRRCAGGCIGVWTVVDRLTQEKLGSVFLLPLPIDTEDTQWELVEGHDLPDAEIEIGYLFKRSAWGKGFATEICQRLLRFAFEETPLAEVVAVVTTDNAASRTVLQKCGFVYEGMRRAYAEQYCGYRITREQFIALPTTNR